MRNPMIALPAVLISTLTACASPPQRETAESAQAPDASSAAAPGAMMQDTLPPELRQMRLHLRQMQGVHADSIRAMLPLHRQMFSGMMGHMEGMGGHMRGMPMMHGDTAWTALMDSLHQDMLRLSDVSAMSDEEVERWMAAHRARAMRMLEMYPAMRRRLP